MIVVHVPNMLQHNAPDKSALANVYVIHTCALVHVATCTYMHACHRLELIVILKRQESFKKLSQLLRDSSSRLNTADVTTAAAGAAAGADTSESTLRYDDVNVDKLSQPSAVDAMLQQYCDDEAYADLYVDLEPYVNQSAVSLPGKFSLHRTYIIFRTLGLRHLTIVDGENRVVGVITRKDLMGFHMEEMPRDQLALYDAVVRFS